MVRYTAYEDYWVGVPIHKPSNQKNSAKFVNFDFNEIVNVYKQAILQLFRSMRGTLVSGLYIGL